MVDRLQDTNRWDNHGELILTGSANAYIAATARQISGYFQGLRICGKANFTNTGAATLNVNGLGAVAIRKDASSALVANDMISGQYYDFLYDATNGWFQLLNPSPGGAFVLKAGDTMTGLLTVQRDVSGNSSHFQAISAESGSDFGPQFKTTRASTSPAAGDLIGRYTNQGKDSGGNDTIYGYIQCRIDDPTDGSEDSSMLVGRMVAGSNVENVIQTAGKQTIWVPAPAMYSSGSPSSGIINVGGAILPYLAFDAAAQEFAYFSIAMPKSWDEGTLSAVFYWAHPATTTNFGVMWACSAGAYSDNDAITNVYSGATVVDTGGTTSNLYISAETSAIDPGNTQIENDLLALLAGRIATDASDTMAVDAFLIGVKIFYTTNAPNDA
jgi:hypothetical protein